MHTFHIVWTISMLVIFTAIIMWAFSRRRRLDFDEAAQLPLEPDDYNRITVTDAEQKNRRVEKK
ncbi:MAG: cbb3-type cytochrome c oxidase subunit 3 [Granulosicoccus sp.]|nr:cbb3-type cytochrome c oxidase subunit 3 [Granulosicoccus sp.]